MRILAYARVSTLEQATTGTSLDGQRDEIARHAASVGADVVWYRDAESGSGGGEDRLEQRRLLAEVRAGDLVVVAKQDRWSRDTSFFLSSIESILKRGARFLSLSERFDPSTPDGKLVSTIMAAVAEQERARILDRTQGTRIRLRASGLWVDGSAPLGYRVEARRPVVVEPGAIVVRRMFHLAAKGLSTRAISALLTAEHPEIPGLDGGAIGRRLRDRRYLGESPTVLYPGPGKRRWSEWKPTHVAIVEPAVFHAVAEALSGRLRSGRTPGPDATSSRFLLRSIIRCAHCGYAVGCVGSHVPGPRAHDYYACERCATVRARRDTSDAQIEAEALAHLEQLAGRLAKASPRRQEASPDFAAARAKVARSVARLVAAVGSGALPLADVRPAREALDRELQKVDADESAHRARVAIVSRAECLAEVTQVRAGWHALTVAEKREFVRRLTERITLRRKAEAKKWERGAVVVEAVWKKCGL